jgi:hypothetical protein
MFKVIVTGGVALVSVGSLFTLSCGSETSAPGSAEAGRDAPGSDGFPSEGPPLVATDSGEDANAGDGDTGASDANDAEASFPPII